MEFQHRVTENVVSGKLQYHEDFYFNYLPNHNFFGFWGVGIAEWFNHYSNRIFCPRSWISLEFVVSGSFTLYWNSRKQDLKRGDIYFLDTSVPHRLQGTPGGKKYGIFFNGGLMSGFIKQKLFRSQEVLRIEKPEELEQLYTAVYQAAQNGDSDFENLVFDILKYLNRANDDQNYPPALNKVLNYLTETSDWWCSREKLAEISGASISTLNRLFLKYLDHSIGEYCQIQRIEQACYLLQFSRFSIKEVAAECGFSTESFFCHMFKKIKKCTPSEFVERHQREYHPIQR